jgi:hypothetical protein
MADSVDEGDTGGKAQRGSRRPGAGRPRKTAEQKAADAEAQADAPPKRKYTKRKQADVTDDEDPNSSAEENLAKKKKTSATTRFNPDSINTIVGDPDQETDEHRKEIQQKIKKLNPNSDIGIYVIRPHPRADARQLWLKYCGNWDNAHDMIKWLTPRENLIRAICADEELGVKVS